jgi:thiamine biosynthesis lipoprotein
VELAPVTGATDGSCTVRLKRPGMKLGLGGLVKGWGVDRAARALRARGLSNFFIQAGGDLYFAGKNGARPWRAGVRDPRGPEDQIFARLEVEDRAFSTSGDYEHFFLEGGTRYHHIIDLRSCWPASASRSVTVLARSATDAEFLTKSAFVLGGEAGLALVESLGATAIIVGADNRVYVSKALRGKLELTAPTP